MGRTATRSRLAVTLALAALLASATPAPATTPVRPAAPAGSSALAGSSPASARSGGLAGPDSLTGFGASAGSRSGPAPAAPPSVPARTPSQSGPADPALAAAIAGWVAASGEADLETLAEDFTYLEQAAAVGRLPGMAAGCARLDTDVAAALRHAPVPDAAAQQSWAAALNLYDLGAHDCVAAATRPDPTLLDRASAEIINGSDELQQLIDRLNEIAA
jgi:hypothetical protein